MVRIVTLASILASLAAVSGAEGSSVVERQNNCNHDNLLRCFLDARYTSSATAYCSGLAPVTSAVSTLTVTSATTTLVTVTAQPSTDTVTSTTTVFTATVPSSTVTVTQTVGARSSFEKRVLAAPAPPNCAVTYPASRLTSACSCISVPPATTYVASATTTKTTTVTSSTTAVPHVQTTVWRTVSTASTSGVTTVSIAVQPTPSNLVLDGNMESLTNWVCDYNGINTTDADCGYAQVTDSTSTNLTQTLKLTTHATAKQREVFKLYSIDPSPLPNGQARTDQSYPMEGGASYLLSFLGKSPTEAAGNWTGPASVTLKNLDLSQQTTWQGLIGRSVGNGWYRFALGYSLPPDRPVQRVLLQFQFVPDGAEHTWYLDDVSLIKS